jgi:hypothetical protein
VARTLEDFIRRYRREVLLVAVALAAQVWLLSGCGVWVGRSNWWQVSLAALVYAVAVMMWLGFVRSSKRLLIGALAVCIVLPCAAVLAEVPVTVVCY